MIVEKNPQEGAVIYRLKVEGRCVGTTDRVSRRVGEFEGDWGVERDLFLRTSSQVGQRVWFKFQRMKVLLNLDTEKGHILLLKKGG